MQFDTITPGWSIVRVQRLYNLLKYYRSLSLSLSLSLNIASAKANSADPDENPSYISSGSSLFVKVPVLGMVHVSRDM